MANLAQISAHWDKRHAVVDQLLRASETYLQLIQRTGEMSVEAGQRGLYSWKGWGSWYEDWLNTPDRD